MTVVKCNLCADHGVSRPAVYDAKTVMGPWANLCDEHMESHGVKAKGLSTRVNVVQVPKAPSTSMDKDGYPTPTVSEPSEDELEEMVYDSVCDATDGCSVEPDGKCSHGHPSWLRKLGLI